MARIGTPLTLTDEDFKELTIMSRSNKLDYRYVVRSRIILKLYAGKNYDQVQKELSIGRAAVAKWKSRFLKDGIAGLKDMAGRGKKPIYTAEDKARIVQKACERPGGGYTNWSQRRIGQELGMSQSTVQKTLKEHALKPHKVEYWCGKSTDPEFEEKMLNVIGLYMSPPEKSLVISVDEKTSIQALDRSQPELPLRVGNPKRLTATYKRNGTVSLIACTGGA